MSPDVTLLAIGGADKTSCRAKPDQRIRLPDGTWEWHGRFSWALGQALLRTQPTSNWISILAEFEHQSRGQDWDQPLIYHGQPTDLFGLGTPLGGSQSFLAHEPQLSR